MTKKQPPINLQLVIGPLCWATILAIVRQYPSRHALQAIVCTSYLFSVSVYYATGSLSSVSHCRPEPLYLYVYYVGLNSPWVFVPAILLVQSVRRITSDARTLHRIRQAPVFSDIRRLVEEGAPKPRHVRNAASDGSGTEGKKAV